MLEAQLMLAATVTSALITAAMLYFYHRKAVQSVQDQSEQVEIYVQDMIRGAVQSAIDTVNTSLKEQLDPILNVNTRAMTMIGNLGAKANQVKMMERQVMEAVNQELPISPDMIESFSPALAQTLRDHPEMMPKAIQVYQKLMGGDGLGALGGLNPASTRRRHPLREE